MSLASHRVLDQLAAEEPCLGAVFLTFGFDPAFFEDHVIRAVCRLTSDPVEQPERYYDEALAALQLTPTCVVADAAQRSPGRRLPYEILDVSQRVFHPKLALLLYEEHARIQIGSGNLTSAGYGLNTELFLRLDIAYEDDPQLHLLRELRGYLGRVGELARQTPRELIRILDELDRRVGDDASPTQPTYQLLDSTRAPILDQLLALVPDGAKVTRVGLLAPFFEQDDADALADASSIFGALRAGCGDDLILDVGVLWDNPSLRNPDNRAYTLDDQLDQLWVWDAEYEDGTRGIEYLTPRALTANQLRYVDARGKGRAYDRDEVEAALADRDLWPQPKPLAYAPAAALKAAGETFAETHLWLHPSTQLIDERPVHRPLHAKLMLVSYEHHGSPFTLVVVGSANASRKALLQSTADTGNVELSLAFCIPRQRRLVDLVPDLVWAPIDTLDLEDRDFPELPPNLALAIEEAVFDAATETLRVVWSGAPPLAPWQLLYAGKPLASGTAPAGEPTVIQPFALERATSELIVRSGDAEATVPILVADLIALPPGPAAPDFGLRELLLILGKRLGLERATRLHQRQLGTDDTNPLEELFGAGVDPVQVFRAWWAVADELADPYASLRAIRLRIDGSLGVRAVWTKITQAANTDLLSTDEAWFYGAELLRTLAEVSYDASPTGVAKAELLDHLRDDLRADLRRLAPARSERRWAHAVRSFYDL